MNKHKSNKIKENSNTVRHLIMGQIITTQNLVAIKEVRHAGQQGTKGTKSLIKIQWSTVSTWQSTYWVTKPHWYPSIHPHLIILGHIHQICQLPTPEQQLYPERCFNNPYHRMSSDLGKNLPCFWFPNLSSNLQYQNKANLRDLIAATGLVISNWIQIVIFSARVTVKFDGWPCKNNRPPLLCYFKLCASFRTRWWI